MLKLVGWGRSDWPREGDLKAHKSARRLKPVGRGKWGVCSGPHASVGPASAPVFFISVFFFFQAKKHLSPSIFTHVSIDWYSLRYVWGSREGKHSSILKMSTQKKQTRT